MLFFPSESGQSDRLIQLDEDSQSSPALRGQCLWLMHYKQRVIVSAKLKKDQLCFIS